MQQYGVVSTYWSMFVVLAAAMLTGMSASTELSNLALNRPCAPLPSCRLLVNGIAENAGELGNGDGDVDNTALDLATTPKKKKSFMSFFSFPSFLERIVVHCRRIKAVAGGFLGREPPEATSPILPPKIKVTLWSKLSSADSKEPIDMRLSIDMNHNFSFEKTPSVQETPDDIDLEIQININTVAVQIEVNRGDGLCGLGKEATQVELLGHGDEIGVPSRKDVAITAAASRRQSLNMMPRERDVRIDMVGAVPMLPALAVDHQSATMKEDIEPRGASDNLDVISSGFFVVYVCAVFIVFLLFAYGCPDTKTDHSEAISVGSARQFRLAARLSLELRRRALRGLRPREDDTLSTASLDGHAETDSIDEASTCSEPEPEEKLCSSSRPGTPRLTDAPPAVACVGTKTQVVQPTATCQPGVDNTWTSTSLALPEASISAQAAQPERRSIEMCRSMQAMFGKAIQHRRSCDKQVVMMFASPMYVHKQELPQFAFDKEWNLLLAAHDESVQYLLKKSRKLPPLASLAPRALTAANLDRMLVPSDVDSGTKVLHLSAHGLDDGSGTLILENGTKPCTGHVFSCKDLRAMLELRSESHALIGPRLVFLNACHSRVAGMQLAQSGVPHVIYGRGSVQDQWSKIFVHKLYTGLFQGRTVMEAYKAATVALRNHPNFPEQAMKSFGLLPEGEGFPHDEVLFPMDQCVVDEMADAGAKMDNDTSSSQASDDEREYSSSDRAEISSLMRTPNPLNRAVPRLPDDFTGRVQDVYAVLQRMKERRLVMVCGSPSSSHGIGKSAVVDAVQRALTMQMGAICVDLRNYKHKCPSLAEWIMQTKETVRKEIARIAGPEDTEMFRRCVRPRKCLQKDISMESLVRDLEELASLSLEEKRWWPATAENGLFQETGGAILVFDNCEELLQQSYFQNAIVDILSRCPGYHVLLSAQRPPAHSCDRYKVEQYQLEGLREQDAARLFLRRLTRRLLWKDLQLGTNDIPEEACNPSGEVVPPAQGKAREKIMDLVAKQLAKQPAIVAQRGNPRALIELAHDCNCRTTQSLQDLLQNSQVKACAAKATHMAMAPIQASMSLCDTETINPP